MDCKKEHNFFKKKLIFIPINEALHWSLCVIVNAGHISQANTEDKNNEVPFILLLDSLKLHDKLKVKTNVLIWLNSEAKKMKYFPEISDPFTMDLVKIYQPKGKFVIA